MGRTCERVKSLLVVAGEASGDRAAAAVVEHFSRVPRAGGIDIFGLGGAALKSRGVELVSDLRASTALGVGEAGARAWNVVRAFAAVLRAVRGRRPRAALLVGYTEFNARLAPRLRAAGVRVVWYGAPQIWAWRPGRASSLRPFVDRMAVVLPFEERLWRDAGVDAEYVGHPALETALLERGDARRTLGMTPYAAAVGILPGSRPHEVRRLLPPMVAAYERVRADRASVDARVLVAPSLDDETRSFLRGFCAQRRIRMYEVDPCSGAMRVLRAFDVTLCASGTASLEAALARAVPVVAYRVGVTTEVAARLLLRAPHIALPNVLLGRRVFAELLQRDVRPSRLADAVADVLDRPGPFVAACAEIEAILGHARTPSVRVARMLLPWLESA
jgi:lipid-A-disaccharide synthase